MYILKLLVIQLLLISSQIEARRKSFGGTQATSTKDLPFLVSLKIDAGPPVNGQVDTSTCSGTYIRPLWVITATHCFSTHFPIQNNKPTYPSNLCMGAIDPYKCPEKDKRVANGLYLHTPGNQFEQNDVSLVSIPKPWDLSSTIQIAKLPTGKVDKKTYHNVECLMGGWGYFGVGSGPSPTLKQSTVSPYVGDPRKCPTDGGAREAKQICVMGKSGIPCQGDSGGPLFCQGVVIGVLRAVSGTTPGTAPTCDSVTGSTAYYNMIQAYNDWIVKIAGAGGSRIVPNNTCLFAIYVSLYFFYILN